MDTDSRDLVKSLLLNLLGLAVGMMLIFISGYFRLPKRVIQSVFFLTVFVFCWLGCNRLAEGKRMYGFTAVLLALLSFIAAFVFTRLVLLFEARYFHVWSGASIVISIVGLVVLLLFCGRRLYLKGKRENLSLPLYSGIVLWQTPSGLLLSGIMYFMFWVVAGIGAAR